LFHDSTNLEAPVSLCKERRFATAVLKEGGLESAPPWFEIGRRSETVATENYSA
jgi:hypothetical protein